MSESLPDQEASWFDITIAGQQFRIASRHGEDHIREVESLLQETFDEVSARVEGAPILNIAYLAALNLASQLLHQKMAQDGQSEEWSQRVEHMVTRLESALSARGIDSANEDGFDTPVVFD